MLLMFEFYGSQISKISMNSEPFENKMNHSLYLRTGFIRLIFKVLLDFEKFNFEVLDFQKLNFEVLDFQKLNFEVLDFQKLNFEVLDFQKFNFELLDFQFRGTRCKTRRNK